MPVANPASKHKNVFTLHTSDKYKNVLNVLNFNHSLIFGDVKNVSCISYICPLLFDQRRFYTNIDRENFKYKLEKSKRLLTDNIKIKRGQMRERKELLVQGIRDKKTKVQEKVREMEEIVERENILTIPNLLCVTRSILAPYIGYVIVQENYQLAIGLILFAGLTDLVNLCFSLYIVVILRIVSLIIDGWIYCTQLGFPS